MIKEKTNPFFYRKVTKEEFDKFVESYPGKIGVICIPTKYGFNVEHIDIRIAEKLNIKFMIGYEEKTFLKPRTLESCSQTNQITNYYICDMSKGKLLKLLSQFYKLNEMYEDSF